jgi:hypothetical protein
MCKVTLLLLLSWVTLSINAQSVFSNQTNIALKKVIEDYPNHFSNIKGDRISTIDLAVNYKSKVTIPGAVNCTLTQYDNNKDAFDWKCELFSTTEFDKAKTKLKELFGQIHNTIIKIPGQRPVILNGQYEVPEKDKPQTKIPFNFLPTINVIQKLNVELQLQQEDGKWKIILQVFEDQSPDLPASMKSEV